MRSEVVRPDLVGLRDAIIRGFSAKTGNAFDLKTGGAEDEVSVKAARGVNGVPTGS